MKIALVSSSFPRSLEDDPGFPASFELAKGLAEAGHELLVLTFTNPRDESDIEREINLGFLPGSLTVFRRQVDFNQYATFQGLSRIPTFAWQLARARDLFVATQERLSSFAPDIIEVQDFDGLGFFFAAQRKYPLLVKAYGPMSLITERGLVGDVPVADRELIAAMESAPVAQADGVAAICHDIASWWSDRTGRPSDEIDIIRTPMTMPASLPERTGIFADRFPTIFFWGRVERLKGADLVVEALPRVVAKYPDARVLIGGQETSEYGKDRPYAETLRERLAELGLSDKVEFLGFMSRERIIETVVNADVCVFPSRYETACYSCIEAMAYGAFCVGTKVGGLQEYCKHGESGWLVEPDDPEALAAGLIYVLGEPDLRARIAARAPAHVRAFCDKKESAERSVAAYSRAIDRFAAAPKTGAFPVFAEFFGNALGDEPSRQSQDRSYDTGYEEGYQAAVRERGLSLGGALYNLLRRACASLLAGR